LSSDLKRSLTVAKSLNLVHLIGRAGREPEMRYTPSSQPVTTFSLATDRRSSKPETPGETDWHRIVCWAKLAEFTNSFVTKGRLLYVAGRLNYRHWTDDSGQQRFGVDIIAHEVLLLDRRPDAAQSDAGSPEAVDDLDLPF
jgi:single-strand DNA-binding protein